MLSLRIMSSICWIILKSYFYFGYQRGGNIQISGLTLDGRRLWAYKEDIAFITHVLLEGIFL